MSVHIRGIGPDGQWLTKAERNDMSLSTATTDAAVVDGLIARVTAFAAAGEYGGNRRHSFGDSRSGRRNLRWLEWGFGRCCEWYRHEVGNGCGLMVHLASERHVRHAASAFLVSSLTGLVLSIVASWLLELIVDAFISWLLWPESAEWRDAVEGEA